MNCCAQNLTWIKQAYHLILAGARYPHQVTWSNPPPVEPPKVVDHIFKVMDITLPEGKGRYRSITKDSLTGEAPKITSSAKSPTPRLTPPTYLLLGYLFPFFSLTNCTQKECAKVFVVSSRVNVHKIPWYRCQRPQIANIKKEKKKHQFHKTNTSSPYNQEIESTPETER